jgi:hypothetical protein
MVRCATAALVAAAIVGVAAVIDHQHKQNVHAAAQEAAWFCAHGRAEACTDFDAVAYERRWERRELAYRWSFGVLAAGGLATAALALRGRRPTGR